MTFNWPDIPFSGTEVDAFVVEYKALAESILDDYYSGNINTDILKPPYKDTENIRVFLENGLTFAAFIIKQRAGNSGPGTDFVIGNSPKRLSLNASERRKLIEDMGCVGVAGQIFKSFTENNSSGAGGLGPGGSGPPPPILGDLSDEITNRDQPCDNFIQKYDENITRNDPDNDDPELKNCSDSILALSISVALSVGYTRWTYTSIYTFWFVLEYMSGRGGVMDRLRFDTLVPSPVAALTSPSSWLREDTATWMGKPKKLTGPIAEPGGAHKFNGYTVKLSSTDSGTGQRRWLISSTSEPANFGALKNLLGDFTVITDGNESIAIDTTPPRSNAGDDQWDAPTGKYYITSISPSNIKNIIDDYDFDYGYEIQRTEESLPGDPFTDDQIKSGPKFTDPNTTACEAATYNNVTGGPIQMGNPMDNRWYRYVIARGHGNGQLPIGGYEFVTGIQCKHKPFTVNLAY